MTKEEFISDLGATFDAACGFNPAAMVYPPNHRMFSVDDRTKFLESLYVKYGENGGTIDYESEPSIVAMMRAQRSSESVQMQMAKYAKYFAEEVKKAGAKK